jgi:hypothetical protein
MQHHPITESESRELALDSYVMQINHHICTNCGQAEKFSQLFEVWCHPTKTRTTGLRDLRPAAKIRSDLPIAVVTRRERQIPLCLSCITAIRPICPAVAPISNAAWAETLKRKYAPPAAEVKVAKTTTPAAKAVPTLDQI